MDEDILVGQVEEIIPAMRVRISGRWYRVSAPLGMSRALLSDLDVLHSLQDLVASDDFTELVPVE